MEALDNLVTIKKLNKEPPDQVEFDGMLAAARTKLQDAKLSGLSKDSQLSLAYSAAHDRHKPRNVAEYEGHLDIDNALLADLLRLTGELEMKVAVLERI